MKITFSLVALLSIAITVSAQQTPQPTSAPCVQRRVCGRQMPKRVMKATPATTAKVETASTDFFVGEAKVEVTKDETVVRLAMAQHGSVFIELPANDGPRYIIPGDPDMATVDEKALERNKRSIIVRPGSLFLPPSARLRTRNPAATVTAQMRSGLVVTFLFYPVDNLAQNVHRCVLTYSRDEVVARRRAAGLPVNLDTTIQERRETTGQSTAPTSISIETTDANKLANEEILERAPSAVASSVERKVKQQLSMPAPPPASTTELRQPATNRFDERIKAMAREALSRAMKGPKGFQDWTKASHGLSLSFFKQSDSEPDFEIAVVAVRNTGKEILKLIPGIPELLVEMTDAKGRPLAIEPIKNLHVEPSDASATILPRATFYYAIAYVPPILGTRQRVKLVVGHTNAADEPASIILAKNQR